MAVYTSNMIGSLRAPWVFRGKQVDWISQIGLSRGTLSVSITTMGTAVKITISADEGVFGYIDELGDAIVAELRA